jgi:hypothetical protein
MSADTKIEWCDHLRRFFVPLRMFWRTLCRAEAESTDYADFQHLIPFNLRGIEGSENLWIREKFPFDDLVPRNFPAILFRDAFVIHGTQVALTKETKLELGLPSRRIQSDRNINQAKTNAPFPNCTHTKLFRTAA